MNWGPQRQIRSKCMVQVETSPSIVGAGMALLCRIPGVAGVREKAAGERVDPYREGPALEGKGTSGMARGVCGPITGQAGAKRSLVWSLVKRGRIQQE